MRTPNILGVAGVVEWVDKFLEYRAIVPRSSGSGYFWFSDGEGLWLEYYWRTPCGRCYVTARCVNYGEVARLIKSPWLRKELKRFIVLVRHEHMADKAFWERQNLTGPLH